MCIRDSLHLEMEPYGGAAIQSLVCGEIAVSPIVTLATARRFM